MFYANNKQVKGIFLNGRNYNYIAYGFGKIIPEDRNVEQLNLNLAYKYLNQYRIKYGTVKDGYENALVIPRFDKPDSNGVFHTPFTYYYNGNIIPTKEVDILITDGNYALRNALVYRDMNINGAINYFASNTDFQGHSVNVFPEKYNYQAMPLLNYEMLNNCSNFNLNINTRFSKASYPTLYNCNNFSGNFRYVGNQDNNYPGFRGFLYQCRDGVFNIDCTNMHGGGSDANTRNYFNFSGIQNCSNIKLNITGSSWQVWPHDRSFTSNCNINTYNVISGFSYMNCCNFNVVLPKDSKPEMDKPFEFLRNANKCNYNLYATGVNLYNYRSGVGHAAFFDGLNNCNLNLLLNSSVAMDKAFGTHLNNCNIVFDNIKADLSTFDGWSNLRNCNITGNVEASSSVQGFLENCDGLNINLNAVKSSRILPMYGCNNVRGKLVCGDTTNIHHSSYLNLNVSRGSLNLINVEHSRFYSNGTNICGVTLNNCMFEIDNSHDFKAYGVSNSNFNMRNSAGTAILDNLNNVDFVERSANYKITNLDNCYNSWIYANTISGTIENVYNTRLELKNNNPEFKTWRVNKCEITGFPASAAYTTNCTFRTSIENAQIRSNYITWANVWPHATPRGSVGLDTWYSTNAGLESVDNFSRCYLNANNASVVNSSTISFSNNKNMIMSLHTFYNGHVTVNLPNYSTNIKLNIDCRNLNLGIFQAGPPHGLEYSSISAGNIYCTTGNDYYVQMNYGTRIYCANFCNVAFSSVGRRFSDNYQPVVLINNYQHANALACNFIGGITRIGRLNFQDNLSVNMYLANGACMFINNVKLNKVEVNNALLFIGSNVAIIQRNVYNGGLIVSRNNYSMDAIGKFVNRNNFTWKFSDSGPWGPMSLLNYCIMV